MAVSPVGKAHEVKARSDPQSILLATRLWSVFEDLIACYMPEQVVILDKTSGKIRASHHLAFQAGEWVHRIAFSGNYVFLATSQRVLVQPFKNQSFDLVPDEVFLAKPDHFFINGGYLVIGAKTEISVWNINEGNSWSSASYPSSVEKVILFNEQLIVSCTDSHIYISYIKDLRKISLRDHGLDHLKLFGNSHFYALCSHEGSVTAYRSSEPDREIHIPLREQILKIVIKDDTFVAVNEWNVMVYPLSSRSVETVEGDKIISGLCQDGNRIYICYDDCVTLFEPINLEEEVLFSRKDCGKIQSICQVGEFSVLNIDGKTAIWPEKEKSGCCAMM